MDEITLDDKTYVSSKRAAKITGYAKDYVGQLCREGRVEARLVGRNWYVLETSLREHRFGSEAQKNDKEVGSNVENQTDNSWQASNYVPEASTTFPDFVNKGPEYKEYIVPASPIAESAVVKEMQSAWQDWFTKKNEEKPAYEPLLESPEVMLERELEEGTHEIEPVVVSSAYEPEPVEPEAVHITRVEEEKPVEQSFSSHSNVTFEEEEEVVPLHRTYMPPVTVTPPSIRQERPRYNELYAPDGRIIRERRVKAKRKSSVILSTLFISIAVVAVAVAAIGSGKFQSFITGSHLGFGPVQFIEGQSTISK